MRKPLVLLGMGMLALSGMLFYAEHKQQISRGDEAVGAIEEVLKAQNQTLSGRLFEGLGQADRDAVLALARWRKKPKMRTFQSDTALSEPHAPKWVIVADRRIRAAGMMDDALLEDALESHQHSIDPLSLYQSKGKYYLFIKGTVEGQVYSAAYVPDAFFSSYRSADGIKVWLALRDGTVIYHPLHRFIGSNASNLRPIAAGIQEIVSGSNSTFTRSYLGLEGKDALGAWTPLPSYGLLVGSEWPKAPKASFNSSSFFWWGLGVGMLGALMVGLAFAGSRRAKENEISPFDEGRLDADAMEYLENARASAERAIQVAKEKERELIEARFEKEEVLGRRGTLEWRLSVLEEYQDRILPNFTGKQVWSEIAELMARRSPGLSLVFYRFSPSSYSLVPETMHGLMEMPSEAKSYVGESRIFLGNTNYLNQLVTTEAFSRWNVKRQKLMPDHQMEFRAYPIQCAGMRGIILAYLDQRMNLDGEMAAALELLESLVKRTSGFCDSLGHLLQSMNAKGSRPAVASAPNDARNRPRPS